MKLFKSNPNKSKAQAMVEFAIALPVLLLLLYGLLETGRLLFIYASVTNATRQAARYGSTSGVGPNGVPRYQDCAGIRAAAQNGDFLNAFDDVDITITYDHGPGTPPITFDTCSGATDTGVNTVSGDRVTVVIHADYDSIVPNIVPFLSRTVANGKPIIGNSSRTLIGTIDIVVTTVVPTSTFTQTPSITPTPTITSTPSRTPTRTLTPLTPVPTWTPSFTPTITRTPTATSAAPTPITGCNTVTLGLLQFTNGNLTMSITNPLSSALRISDVTVQWNHDKGHEQGNKKIRLLSASLGGVFWSGDVYQSSYTITPASPTYIPASTTSTISFSFDQAYDEWDNTESITINLSTPGCAGVVLYQNQH